MVAHSLRMATGNVCRRIPLRVTNSNVSGWYICICSAPKVLKRSCEEVIYLLFISLDVTQRISPSQYSEREVEGVFPPENEARLDKRSHAQPSGNSNGISSSMHFTLSSANFS